MIDGRATNKYEFVKEVGDSIWVETIFADEQSGIPIRFETLGRSDANAGAITIYRHDPSIRIDPPTVDLDQRRSASLQRLAEEAQKGDPACRAAFFAAIQRGETAAFEFVIKGSFESGYGVAGTFVPSDAIHYRFAISAFGTFEETVAASGRAWVKKSQRWTEVPEKQDRVERVITSLFPRPDDVGHVKCLGSVAMDGRDYDAYDYDVYRDSESAKALYSHRSMFVEKASGNPFRNVSVSRTNASQWIETRRYDPALTIQAPPPASAAPAETSRRATGSTWFPFQWGPADAYWPPIGPNWPPFILTPPTDWPPEDPK